LSPESPDLRPDAVFARRANVVLREVAGERLLIPIRREVAELRSIFVLTGIGAFIWELLDGERSLGAVLAVIVEHYDIGAEQAGADLAAFVARLAEAGIAEQRG
jgi:hypothetical protein